MGDCPIHQGEGLEHLPCQSYQEPVQLLFMEDTSAEFRRRDGEVRGAGCRLETDVEREAIAMAAVISNTSGLRIGSDGICCWRGSIKRADGSRVLSA